MYVRTSFLFIFQELRQLLDLVWETLRNFIFHLARPCASLDVRFKVVWIFESDYVWLRQISGFVFNLNQRMFRSNTFAWNQAQKLK